MIEEERTMDEKQSVPTEEQRKLHAESTQLLNQRFLLTTAAITVFGAFSSWMIPKDPSNHPEMVGRLLFAGAALLHFFLLLLFMWNRFLANLQAIVNSYLLLKNASQWEVDWRKYRKKPGAISTGRVQTWVFLALGILTALWPYVLSCTYDLPLDWKWKVFDGAAMLIYLTLVCGFGFRQWLREDDAVVKRWKDVLGMKDNGQDQRTV
jgi:hypothetical protein